MDADVIFFLCVPFGAAAIWVFIWYLSCTSRKKSAERNGEKTPVLSNVHTFYAFTGIVGQFMYWLLMLMVADHVAHSLVYAANANAQTILRSAISYSQEAPDAFTDTVIGEITADPEKGSFEEYIQQYVSGMNKGWYAIIPGENGKPECAFFSLSPLDSERIAQKPEFDEQVKIPMNPFVKNDKLLGYYSEKDTADLK